MRSPRTRLSDIQTVPLAYTVTDTDLLHSITKKYGFDILAYLDKNKINKKQPVSLARGLEHALDADDKEGWPLGHLNITFLTCVDCEDYIQLLNNGFNCNRVAEDSTGVLLVVSATILEFRSHCEPESFYNSITPILDSYLCQTKNS